MFTAEIPMMSWNIKAGGYDRSYAVHPDEPVPSRGEAIRMCIAEQRSKGVRAVVLTDANRWDETYGGNEGIAAHTGFKEACFTRLGDERLEQNNGAGIGIAMATDEKVNRFSVIDMETRNALAMILDVGKYGLQVAGVYLDDLDEDVRFGQFRALHAQLERGVPTILTGDFNALRPQLSGASRRDRLADVAVRAAAHLLPAAASIRPKYQELAQSVRGMNRRIVVPDIIAHGYRDADVLQRPTAPAMFPAFGIDYVFHDERTDVRDFIVHNTPAAKAASDHLPIAYSVFA